FIAAGKSTRLDMTLTLSPDPGFDPTLAAFGFQNVGVTISPLNGSPNASPPGVFGFSASGLPQVDFQLPVTYGTPGTYFPTFAADVSYAETHLVFEQISSIGCGFFGLQPCFGNVPETAGFGVFLNGDVQVQVNPASPVPGPI